ncbi:MAG TPA: hypothetical protein VKR21_04820 [Solirubrobacteraceae bacterium]|nr:hypothetical protein [Solirubrobacteraceae bacterium]
MIDTLVDALRAEGGTLAELVTPPVDPQAFAAGPAQLAASGPRVAAHAADYELLLEMIFEGSLLHYGTGRVVQTTDPDLALLLGDQLYALGLARLAALGDLEAVDTLATVISRLAQAHAEGDGASAEAIWSAGARAIGWGSPGSSSS